MTTDERSTGTKGSASAVGHVGSQQYEIRVKGHLGSQWTAWFDGFTVVNGDDGTTVIRGLLVDQAALHGLLQRLRDVGIPLVSLTQLPPDASNAPRALDIEGN